MKRNIILYCITAVIVLGAGYAWYISPNHTQVSNPSGNTISSSTEQDFFEATVHDTERLMGFLSNTEIVVPDTTVHVVLQNGKGEFTNGEAKGKVMVGSLLGLVKVNDTYDAFVDLAVNNGGSGTFHYVTLFHLTVQTIEQTSSVFVGDRVLVKSVTSDGVRDDASYDAKIIYLDRKESEPMSAEPKEQKEITFSVSDNTIKEK